MPVAVLIISIVMLTLGTSFFFYVDTTTQRDCNSLRSYQTSKMYPIDFCSSGMIAYARSESSLPIILTVGPLETVTMQLTNNAVLTTDFDIVAIGEVTSIQNVPMVVDDWYVVAVIRRGSPSLVITYTVSYQYTCHPFLQDGWTVIAIGVGLLATSSFQKYREIVQRELPQKVSTNKRSVKPARKHNRS